jgi:hypothetical protein
MVKVSVVCFSVNLFIVWLIYAVLTATDPFTDDLTIPTDIEIHQPLSFTFKNNNSEIDWPLLNTEVPVNIDFDLVKWYQPGIYQFALWYKSDVDGYVYVKAYEITKGTPLSVSRLKDRSRLTISKSSALTFYHNDFSIYEGDWGYPYAARFEIWFSPNSKVDDFKVAEKNYIIEGWMR